MSGMGRREFVALLGGAAAAWPLVARAQQPANKNEHGQRQTGTRANPMAIPLAFRVTISYREKAFKLESATSVQKITPPSAALEGADYGAGAWFAIEGPKGRTLYRRGIDNPFDGHEVFTGEKQEMRRVHVPGLPVGVSLLLPEIDGAETLAVYASAPDREGKAGPAKRVFAVSMRDVAELAAKGGSTHER